MRLLFTFLAGLATAASQCSSSWYYQAGKQYNYEVVTENSVLFTDKGFEGDSRAADERVEGVLSLNVVADCVAEVTYLFSRRRESSSARVFFGAGSINSVSFPEGQTVESNNVLKAILSALQLDEEGVKNHPRTVAEITHNGFSDSEYTCNCGCETCDCETCDGIVVTRIPTMTIDTTHSGRSQVLQTLTGKLAIDNTLDILMEPIVCEYSVRRTIPESVRCEQTVRGSEIDTLISSITITYESESSAESVLGSAAMTPAEGLKIKHTEHFNDVCQGDMGCLLDMFTSVVNNDHMAVKNQFLLRKSIRSLNADQLAALITNVAVDPVAITHIFTELTKCGTEACILSASVMLESVELPVYPAVFRAVQYSTPTEHMINLMANDIAVSSSVEKLNIFLGAIKEVELTNYDVVLSMIKTLIGDSCQAVQESFTLTGYFASQTETTETEMVVALKIAQALAPEVLRPLLDDVTKCLTYNGAATIVENAIIAIGPFYTAEQIITNVPAVTPASVAAIIVSIREASPSVTTADIYKLFEARYGKAMSTEKAFINQMILAIDNTESVEANYRWAKSLRLPLPAALEEVELFSGLTLSTNVITSGASVTIKNELINGEGLRLVEGDIIINSMYDMIKYALSGYYRCPESLWTAVLATENSMVTLIESIINLNFESILTNNALSNVRGFIQMGGVQFKLLGEEINADWIVSLFENVQKFLNSEKTSYKPTLAEIYSIFTNGLEHNYFNIFDSRETMSLGLVSGLKVTSTVASITAVGYNGIILPHLLSLGKSGDIKMSPALSHGIISETKLSSVSLDKTATTIFSSHVSFSGELAYEKSATGLELSLRLAPSSSPMTFHQWQYIDNDFSRDVQMVFSSYPVLASNVQVRSCDQGFEISLDREIGIHLLTRVAEGVLTVSGSVDGLGAVSTTVSGTVLDGALSADVRTETGINANVQIKSACLSVADCSLTGDISLPNTAPISSHTRMEFTSPNFSFRSQNMIGERVLLHMMADATPENVRIASKSDVVRADTDLLCRHNLLKGDAVKTASCDLTFNEKFGLLTLNKERNTYSWDLRTNVATLLGSFNLRRELDLKFFSYPAGLYTTAAELTPAALANHELVDLVMAWPVQSSGARLIALQLEISQRTITKFRLQQKNGGHRLNWVIPALDLRLLNNWDAQSIDWVHRVQMNPRKLEKLTAAAGFRIRASKLVAALDARGLMVHQISVSYPSGDSCSQQFATPEGSLVTRFNLGTSSLCLSAGAGHVAARANAAESWAPSWASFDLYTGFNPVEKAAIFSLVNDLLTTKVTGNWLVTLTGKNKEIAVGTSIKASGLLLVDPLSASVEVRGQAKGKDLAAILSGAFQGTPFELKLVGEMRPVTVDGIVTDAILLYPGEGNIFNLQEIGIHLINKIPAGITLKQRDFDAKWIVDAFSKVALVDIVNRDAVIPVAKFLLRADTAALTINVVNTAPVAEIALSIEYTSGITANVRLPGVAVDVAKNANSVHRIDAIAENVGELACIVTPRNATLPSVTLINLGIDNTINNLAIASGVRLSGSTKILADRNGIKADGFKIHHILHVLGYDINIDTELFSKEASAYTPVAAPFKWCDVEGEISYAWVQVHQRNAHLGSLGNWVKLGAQDKCSNMIGIFREQYHQIAAMTVGGVNKARVMVPTSYTTTAPVTWDLVISDKVETSLNTPIADVYVTANGAVYTLNAISANDVVLADSILDLSARHLKVVCDLTSLDIPVATTIETIKDKKWQKSTFDVAVAGNRATGAVDINTVNLRTGVISSGTVLGFVWDTNINVINPLVHTVAIKGSWTSSSSSLFARTQSYPFSFESDINGYSHVKSAFTGFDLNLAHETTIALTPLSIVSESVVTSPWTSIVCSANVAQSGKVYTATINAKTGSYEGKLVAVINDALNALNLDYVQTGVAEIVLNLASSAASLKIDAPVADLITKIDLNLAPVTISVTGQYAADSINLIASAKSVNLELSEILKFVSVHGPVIKADLEITNRGAYHAELSRKSILPVIVTVNDAVVGSHSLIINAAKVEMKNEVSSIGLASTLSASLALPVDITLEGTFKGPFHVIVSQNKLLADVLIAGNALKISKNACDLVVEFNNAKTLFSAVVCTDTITADLRVDDATLGKVEAHIKGAAATLVIESEALATSVNLQLNAVPETFVLDLAANIVGHQAAVTISVPAHKILINLPAIGETIPAVVFTLTEANGIVTKELTIGTILSNKMTVDLRKVIVSINGQIGKSYSIFFSLPEERVVVDIPTIAHFELARAAGVISELLQIEGLGQNAITVDTNKWIVSVKNTLFATIEINADWQRRVAVLKVPSKARFEITEVDGLVTLQTQIKGVGKNTVTVRPATWEITAEGKIVVSYSVLVSPLDIYNQVMALATSTSAPMVSTHFLALRAEGIITLEVTPTLLSVILAENKFLNLSHTAPVIALSSAWTTNTIQTTFDTSKLELNIAASILGNTLESYVSVVAPAANVLIRAAGVEYTASYQNGHIALNVPEVAVVDLTVTDGVARGTIGIGIGIGVATISINQMVISRVNLAGINLLVVSDIDMVANIAGYELSTVASLTSSGIAYQITSDVGAGFTLNLVGRTTGVLPTGNFTDLTLYEANSEMTFGLSNEYISQGLSYNTRLVAGDLESDITIDTVLLKVKLSVATEKLTLKKFVTKDLLINTEINGAKVFTTGGVSYIAGKAFEIYPTQIRSGDATLFLIGGSSETPIAFDLKTLKLVPNDNLVIKILDTRIVAKLIALNNFQVNVADTVVLSRNKNILHAAVTVTPLSISTDIALAKTGFRQAVRVLNGETKLVVGTHELDIAAGILNIDWLILENVIKANVKVGESATVNINSDLFKLNTELTTAGYTLALQSEPIRAQAAINQGKLEVAIASDLAQLKIMLTPDLVDNVIILRTSNGIKINANSESIKKMKLQMTSPVLKSIINVNNNNIDAKLLSGSILIVGNCKDFCKRSHVKISSGEKTVLETTVAVSGNTIQANLVSGELVVTLKADPSTTSVATVTYKDLYNLTGQLAAGRVFEVTFETPATLIRLSNSSFVLVNQPLNIEARINENGSGKVILKINPNQDLLINLVRKPSGDITLDADIYKLIVADVQIVKGVLSGDVTIIDTNIKGRIAPNNARFVITGENLNVKGSASTGKFNVTMIAPVAGSVDYKNKTMVVTTTSRTYTMTSENGLIKVLPKMRTAQQ